MMSQRLAEIKPDREVDVKEGVTLFCGTDP